MIKLSIKLVLSFIAFSLGLLFYFQSQQIDPKVIMALIAALGYMIMSGIDVWDYCQSAIKKTKDETFVRNRNLRNILDNFKANFVQRLTKLEIINDKAELSYEKIYELSQTASVIDLLTRNELPGIVDELEEFGRLYKQST